MKDFELDLITEIFGTWADKVNEKVNFIQQVRNDTGFAEIDAEELYLKDINKLSVVLENNGYEISLIGRGQHDSSMDIWIHRRL